MRWFETVINELAGFQAVKSDSDDTRWVCELLMIWCRAAAASSSAERDPWSDLDTLRRCWANGLLQRRGRRSVDAAAAVRRTTAAVEFCRRRRRWHRYRQRLSNAVSSALRPVASELTLWWPTVAIWVQLWSILCQTVSFVIFDIRALWRSGLSVRVPRCQKLQMTASPGLAQDAL